MSKPHSYMFDLDNTLYQDKSDFFESVKQKMNEYVSEFLNVSLEEAAIIRDDYYHKYGTTLTGLRKLHNADPDHFLDYIDNVELHQLTPDYELVDLIANLSGKRYILTNASDFHAHRILKHLKLDEHFDGVFTLQTANHIPKPNMEYYRQFLKKYDVNPKGAVFFEDSSHNLLPAAELGMKTVLIKTACPKAMQHHTHQDVHYVVDCIKEHLAQY